MSPTAYRQPHPPPPAGLNGSQRPPHVPTARVALCRANFPPCPFAPLAPPHIAAQQEVWMTIPATRVAPVSCTGCRSWWRSKAKVAQWTRRKGRGGELGKGGGGWGRVGGGGGGRRVQCYFTSTETIRTIRDGEAGTVRSPRLSLSSSTLL